MTDGSENVLVTGGAGVIGSNLVRELAKLDNQSTIVILDDFSSGFRNNLSGLANTILIEGDIGDSTSLEEAFSYKPRKVFHLAALFANQNSVDFPVKDLRTNGEGTIKVLEHCVKANVDRIVYTSSSCVYGNLADMTEPRTGNLDTPYAITKLLGEQYMEFFSEHYGLETVSARLFNTYGPFDFPGEYRSVVPNFFRLAMDKRPLTVHGNGKSIRSYTFVSDTVRGLIKSMYNLRLETHKSCVINIGNDTPVSSIELAQKINRITGNPAGIEHTPQRSWDKVYSRLPNLEKMSTELNWRPQVEIDEGLRIYKDWYNEHIL